MRAAVRARIRLSCRASSMIGQVAVRVISSSLGNVVYILRAIQLHQHDVTVQPIPVGVARRSGSACVSSIALIGGDAANEVSIMQHIMAQTRARLTISFAFFICAPLPTV